MNARGTDILVERVLEAGLLSETPHFGCTYYAQCPSETFGQTTLSLDDLAHHGASLRFIFRGNGEVEFWACPSKLSTYQLACIFNGHSEDAIEDLLAFSLDSIPCINKTLELYRKPDSHEENSQLLKIWSHVDPRLCDEPEDTNCSSPWWKFWQ